MITLQRTDGNNIDFIELVSQLDDYLKVIDGQDHQFYNSFNKIKDLQYVVVIYVGKLAVGCGAIKHYDDNTVEIKRMFVNPDYRGKKLATTILIELENWGIELGCTEAILETGARMPDAIALYQKNKYKRIPNYGQYVRVKNSRCFKKIIKT